MTSHLFEVMKEFNTNGTIVSIEPYGNGHINDTYKVVTSEKVYILQRINQFVFKDPIALMRNMYHVTEYLRVQLNQQHDQTFETLTCISTQDGNVYYCDDASNVWRLTYFITGSVSYEQVENAQQFKESGRAFGYFQYLLKDFPAETLNETIKDFHNTPKRYQRFCEVVAKDPYNRANSVKDLIQFVHERRDFMTILWDAYDAGVITKRVTHNDTKLNNILFNEITGDAQCIIDLDTVMPGFVHDDFGDSIRFGATTAKEDERDISKVHFDLKLYRLYLEGFISGTQGSLTTQEIELLPVGAKMMTLECGMRFLTDYLEGDVYFKTAYEDHNVVRCRTQFKLVSDMEAVWKQLEQLSAEVIN